MSNTTDTGLLLRILRETNCELFGQDGDYRLTFYDESLRLTDDEAELVKEMWS